MKSETDFEHRCEPPYASEDGKLGKGFAFSGVPLQARDIRNRERIRRIVGLQNFPESENQS